jgi:macrodomain Ter protein organizer (MatP/YcbG family)
VKTSVPLPFNVHVRLAALAALRGQTLGELAAEFIAAGVDASGVRVSMEETN